MSYKIVRNAQGDVVAFGPNDKNYEPRVKSGEVLSIEDVFTPPAIKPETQKIDLNSLTEAEKQSLINLVRVISMDRTGV